jgi:DNA-binding response OmpR family regulator
MKKLRYTILIIEDQEETRSKIANYFNINGYKVLSVKNTTDAVKLLKTKRPDLVITEISFPYMDGFQFLEYLRKTSNTALIPIIFISTKIDSSVLKKILAYNVNNFLKIPFKISELNKLVKELLKENKSIK